MLALPLPVCGRGDPREAAIEARTRYQVELLSWAPRTDGSLAVSLRVSGPADTPLRELTVEIVRKRADATNLGSDWVRLDVSGMVRGSALQKDFVLPGGEEVPEGLAVELHPDPTPEVIPHLRELPPR